jgi:hypothetical protein
MKNLIIAISLLSFLIGCGGGSGNTSVGGGVSYTHSQLAEEFIYDLNYRLGYDVELVKTNTQQWDYIVVFDHDLGTYDAYDLDHYNPGENIAAFLNNNDYSFYYDLDYIGGNDYQDWFTGTIFEETTASQKDLEKMGAFTEGLAIKRASEQLVAEFGLSDERGIEVAKVAHSYYKASKARSMTNADADIFASEVLGSSITDLKAAYVKSMEGKSEDLTNLIELASETNSISPEHTQKLIEKVFK